MRPEDRPDADHDASADDGASDDEARASDRIVDTGARIELHRDGTVVGYADYRLDGSVMVVPYVETHPAHRGHGIGAVVVDAVAQHALAHELRIRPLCGFAAGELRARDDAGELLERR